jgi:ribosomal protein L11 methyltransferase
MGAQAASVRAFLVDFPVHVEDELLARIWEMKTLGTEERPALAGRQCLLAYFPLDVDLAPLVAWLQDQQGVLTETAVPDVDWVARFRETFRGSEYAGFRIVPVWEQLEPTPGTLIVDPGRAFGTGTHETTRLCLDAIRRVSTARPVGRVLDLGAGTGLLALAALQCGASFALATDCDPEATASARLHAELNLPPLHVLLGDGGRPLQLQRFDLVLANIAAPLLLERADEIMSLVAPKGILALSGLLTCDVEEVTRAYFQCGRPEILRDGEWAALLFGLMREL